MKVDKDKFISECAKNSGTFRWLKIKIKVKENPDRAGKDCHVFYECILKGEHFTLDMGWRRYDNDDKEDFNRVTGVEGENLKYKFRKNAKADIRKDVVQIKRRGKMNIPPSIYPKQVSAILKFFQIKHPGKKMKDMAERETGSERADPARHVFKTEDVVNLLNKHKIAKIYAHAAISSLS